MHKKKDNSPRSTQHSRDKILQVQETDRAILSLLRRAEQNRKSKEPRKTSYTEEFFASIQIF